MNSKLAIYIPTYRRFKAVSSCIENVLQQCIKNNYIIPIYISNNDKNDLKLQEYIKKIKSEYKYIFYSENDENIGLDGNMLKGFQISNTKYCLMLGDDDELSECALSKIIKMINEEETFVFAILGKSEGAFSWEKNETKIIKYEDPVACFKKYADGMPWGTLICNLESFSKLSRIDITKYFGTAHLYAGVCWEMAFLENGKMKIIIMNDKIINSKEEMLKTWNEYYSDIYILGVPRWYESLNKMYHSVAVEQKRAWEKAQLRTTQIFYMLKDNDMKDYSHFVQKYNSFLINLKITLVLLCPVYFKHLMLKIIKMRRQLYVRRKNV